MSTPIVTAPFTPEQLISLNGYQHSGVFHEFTCGTDSTHLPLIAIPQGWRCAECDYTQDWAHPWMADFTWRKQMQDMRAWGYQ